MTAKETEVYVFVRWLDFEMAGWGERKSSNIYNLIVYQRTL